MLAPVLARLEGLAGVTAARVDSSGTFFWLALDPRADEAPVADLARGVLGAGARALPAGEAEEQLAAHARGDPWLTAREVMALSYVESRILAARVSEEVQRRAGGTSDEREVVAEAIRASLFAAMERVHAEGGRAASGWIYDAWPAISCDAAERCRRRIPPELHAAVAALLPRILTR